MTPPKPCRRAGLRLLVAIALAAVVTTCKRSGPSTDVREDELVIFAAASLRDVFTSLGEDFERRHVGVEITFNFAGTQELRTQLEHGAAVDVFASADMRQMDELVRSSLVAESMVFARNEPVIVVFMDGSDTVESLADLPKAERVVIGTAEVPIGRYTLQILDRARATLGQDFRARVEAKVVSRELSVRQVLMKVVLGEAQAGIVYRTDASSAQDRVRVVAIPPEINVIAEYPIAVVTGAAHSNLARAWVEFVLSTEGQRELASAGFRGADEEPRH
ncbi:MAG: molybdate ABC transporter substrate-binding protein [Myxococcales bacterium]|nr:molybdate ABC transporter substrate-binding protein [Myxococcales bacterium]